MASSKKGAAVTPRKAGRPAAKKAPRQPKAERSKADKPLTARQAETARKARLYSTLRDTLVGISSHPSEYPPTLARLLELAGQPLDADALTTVAGTKRGSDLQLSLKVAKGEPASRYGDAVAFLLADLERVASSPLLLYRVLRNAQYSSTPRAKRSRANAFDIAALTKMVSTSLAKPFAAALRAYAGRNEMPAGIGMVRGDDPLFFLIEHAVLGARFPDHGAVTSHGLAEPQPVAVVPVGLAEFERKFQTAFERLDVQSGNQNYVLLHDLRRALSDIPRSEFDARLNDLRRNKTYSLDSADGRHVRLTPEQLEAGIREASSLLVYVARR